jgi:hypothetical protein
MLKLVIYSTLIYGIYYAFTLYVLYTIGQKLTIECNFNLDEIKELKIRKASSSEIEMYVHKKYTCLKEKQNSIENFFFPVPENWINPPLGSLTYDKLPNS